jgi:hypothetical protein
MFGNASTSTRAVERQRASVRFDDFAQLGHQLADFDHHRSRLGDAGNGGRRD